MRFAVQFPPWALALLAAAVVALSMAAYRRAAGLRRANRALLVALRAAALALVVVCLLRPLAPVPPEARQDGVIAVLVDGSRSMGLRDADGLARVARAGTLLTGTIAPALAGKFKVESFLFGDRLTPAGDAALAATADRTDLAGAIRTVSERHRGRGLAGIVVLSDGNDTSGADLAEAGAQAGVPILAVGLGRADAPDREIAALATGESSLDASLVDLTATIAARGLPGSFAVRLLQNGQVVDRRSITPAANGAPARVVFTVAPDRTVPTIYTVDLPDADGELTAGNNRARALVPPPGRRRLLLSLEGAPGFEHTFLKRAWSDDPSLEVDSVVRKGRNDQGVDTFFVQAGGARSGSLVSGFPASREALFAYDAVVLANFDVHTLSRDQLELLRAFTSERGGGLLFIGARTFETQGMRGSPIEELLPLRLGSGSAVVPAAAASDTARVRPTADGERHPLMRIAATDDETRKRWAGLPSLSGVVQMGGPRPGASVLAVTDGGAGTPVVAVQRFGAGRTVLFAGEASWRWKMMQPATDPSYDRFWRQVARWLSADTAELLSAAAPASVLPGESIDLQIAARTPEFTPAPGADVRVTLEGPGGIGRPIVPALTDAARGVFTARMPPAERGVYRAILERADSSGPSARTELRWLVGGLDRELADPGLNDAGLRRLAQTSGGRYASVEEAADAASWLATAARPVVGETQWRDAWHTGWMFALIVLIVSVEWTLRRRWGLR